MGLFERRRYDIERRGGGFVGICREENCVWETILYKTKFDAKINVLLHRRVYHDGS